MSEATFKSRTSGRSILAAILAIVLACGLCPGFAHAAQLEAGQVSGAQAGASDQSLSTQATKTVYVITSSASAIAQGGSTMKGSMTYSYDKNGLLKKRVGTDKYGKTTTAYTYNGAVLKAMKQKDPAIESASTYSANKKGQITKAVRVNSFPTGGKETCTYNAKYASGKVGKVTCKTVLELTDGTTSSSTSASTYAYKNGRVASATVDGYKLAYGYDAQGNYNDIGGSRYKNAYNAQKLLTKRVLSEEGFKHTDTYKYKAIKVKASVADKVAAQQWALLNNNLNFAFGLDE